MTPLLQLSVVPRLRDAIDQIADGVLRRIVSQRHKAERIRLLVIPLVFS